MKTKLRSLEVCAVGFLVLAACTSARGVDEADLNFCITNPGLIVSADENTSQSDLKIRYCNYIPAGGDLKVIIVSVRGEEIIYRITTPIGVRVYSEYRFGKNGDLLLMSYGVDNPDEKGNFFDFDLYEIGKNGAIKSGKSENRPRLSNVM